MAEKRNITELFIRIGRLTAMFAVFILILGLVSRASAKSTVYEEGKCGPSSSYQILKAESEFTVIIRGSGKITKTKIAAFAGEEDRVRVVVGEGITEIGEEAFLSNHVVEVSFPSTLRNIGAWAFGWNENLEELNLPNEIESIGEAAFYKTAIKDFKIPSRTSFIGRYAFAYCDHLKNMTIPATVKKVEGATFAHCANLEHVTVPSNWNDIPPSFILGCAKIRSFTIPRNVKIIRPGAFQESGLTSIDIPDSVVEIQNHAVREEDEWACVPGLECRDDSAYLGAFWRCTSLRSIRLSNNIKTLGNRTFTGCTALEEIELPAKLTTLGGDLGKWGVFCDCSSLKRVIIPTSVKTISEWAFLRCESLSDLYYEGTESEWKKLEIQPMGNYNYTHDARVHYNCRTGKIFRAEDYHGEANLVIPEGYTRIDEFALKDCKTLKNVSLPTTLEYIGYYAFQNCKGLTSVTVPGRVRFLNRGAFNGCTNLSEVKIASGVSLIGTDSEGTFSGQVKPGGFGTFEGCTNLKSVYIPKTVTSIGEYSFYECPALRDVYYEGPKEAWAKISIVNGSNQPVISVAKKHFNSPRIVVREPNCPSAKYRDVDVMQWYHPYVDYAISKGIMNGTGTDTFSPGANVTRATLVQVLYAREHRPSAPTQNRFSDVNNGKWYTSAVLWAYANGIVSGYNDGTFKPNRNISRQEMAVMIYAYAKFKGWNLSERENLNIFSDKNDVSEYAIKAVRWAVGNKYLSGTGGNMLSPKGTTTRAQLATVMKAISEKNKS